MTRGADVPNGRTRPTAIALLAVTAIAPVALSTNVTVATAETTPASTHELLSLNANGKAPKDESQSPDISADGAWVTFGSRARGLLEGEPLHGRDYQIYLRSRETGETTLVSRGVQGRKGNSSSYISRVSADGAFVLFESAAWNLVPRDKRDDDTELFLRDVEAGTTTLVAQGMNGRAANRGSYHGDLSADNRFVVFESYASNLVPEDTDVFRDVFLLDRTTGATTVLSQGIDGEPNHQLSAEPVISADGRTVVYHSEAHNLVPGDTNRSRDIFTYDTVSHETEMISRAPDGTPGNADSSSPAISADGRYVAFSTDASNLATAGGGFHGVYVRDLETDVTTLVSRAVDGSYADGRSYNPEVSDGGLAVTFRSYATNLVIDDTNGDQDVFLVDTASGETIRVSRPDPRYADRGGSVDPAITADGSSVAFRAGDRFVAADHNKLSDVYLWSGS